MPVRDLAAGLPISRPAVSQHLRVLTDAGLLSVTPQGTRRLYAIAPDGIAGLRAYLDQVWDEALANFAAAAHAEAVQVSHAKPTGSDPTSTNSKE